METLKTTQQPEKYGLPTATTMVMGSIIGSGVFALPAALAQYGPLSILAFIAVSLGAMALAVAFKIMYKRNPRSGGEYVFTRGAFGDFPGFLAAWAFWVSCWTAAAAVVTAFVGYVEVFINKDHNPVGSIAIGLVGLWVPALICISGVKNMGKVQFVLTLMKYVPLLILSVVGIFHLKSANFGQFNPSGKSTFMAFIGACAVGIYSYLGIEASTATADRIKDPHVNVPKSQWIGIVLTAALYLLSIVAVMGTVPHNQLVNSTAPFADSANNIFGGSWSGSVVALLACVSCFGLMVGWMLITVEVPAEAAKDGIFPSFFGQYNEKGIPTKAIILSTALASLLLIFAYTQFDKVFSTMVLLNVVVSVMPYIFATVSELYLMSKEAKLGKQPLAFWKNVGIVAIALFFSIMAFIGSGKDAIVAGLIAMALGIPVYYIQYKKTLSVQMSS
ncbi:MAG: amino acid permease [Micrococcaceae bacterium]